MNSMVKPDAGFFFGDADRIEREYLPLAHRVDIGVSTLLRG
jgi:hypothetical protein